MIKKEGLTTQIVRAENPQVEPRGPAKDKQGISMPGIY